MNYKNLFIKLEETIDRIERSDATLDTLAAILERLVTDFRDELGILGARLYARDDEYFVLQTEYPPTERDETLRIPVSYPPVQVLLQQGFVLYEMENPQVDRAIEGAIGGQLFAAICVGQGRQRIVAFNLAHSADWQHLISSLNTIRHVVNLKLRKEHLEERLAEARSIQLSLLPASSPEFEDYGIHGRTRPAEDVGGDLYDFIPVSERSLAVAIADAAGHGLPAALQARDAVIGLRMSVEERWRITATIEKLNKVVGRSARVSRFISLFYCELEPGGSFVYCNAGHNPALLLRDGLIDELSLGGVVLGPNPDAVYRRGFARLPRGGALLLYTDGIVEASDNTDEQFGMDRLGAVLQEHAANGAEALVDAVFDAVESFSGRGAPNDDQTVVAIVRTRVSDR